MSPKKSNTQHSTSHIEQDKFTDEKQRRYRRVTNKITSQIQWALILHKLKTWNNWNPDVAQLSFDQDWNITEDKSKDAQKKWAIDILWHIEDINILNIKDNLYQMINKEKIIKENDKKHLKDGINNFIRRQFPRANLESKERLPHKAFRRHYSRVAKEQTDLNEKWQRLYKDICLSLANLLFEKDNENLHKKNLHKTWEKTKINYNFVNQEWQITQEWLQYIWTVFLTAIKNIPNSWDSKTFHKIFHDWDFNFLRKEDSAGNPIIGTLNHYVRAIMYLMDYNWFNAYAEWWETGTNEWYIAKKALLNWLYNASQLENIETHQKTSDKWVIHNQLYEKWGAHKGDVVTPTDWEFTARLKTDSSKLLKIWWRTKDIKDESWLRATYYWSWKNHDEVVQSISDLSSKFLSDVKEIDWIYIQNITSAKKKDFISTEDEDTILERLVDNIWFNYNGEIPEISKRQQFGAKQPKLESISSKYESRQHKKPSPGLQEAYKIASGEIIRWANWDYSDFKLIVEYFIKADEFNEWNEDSKNHIDKDTTLYQEISFYPHDNDLNMWNHWILELEKRIFNRVRTVNVPDIWKSISLHRLRYYTETAIKDISFEIDIYEDKVKRWLLPPPQTDDYKYLSIGDQKISLEWLIYRNQNNTDRFDTLILMILNYFITHNKIFYINKKGDWFHGLITKEQLHSKTAYKWRRFTTSDQLRNIALDADNEDHSIAFYTPNTTKVYDNFYVVNLWDLWDFIKLEK